MLENRRFYLKNAFPSRKNPWFGAEKWVGGEFFVVFSAIFSIKKAVS
jgi:hypothetical protein